MVCAGPLVMRDKMIGVQHEGERSTTSSTARPFQTLLVIPIREVSSPLWPTLWRQCKGGHLDTYQSSDGKQELLQRLNSHQMRDVQGAGDNHLMQNGHLGNQMTHGISQKATKQPWWLTIPQMQNPPFMYRAVGCFWKVAAQARSTPSPFSG